MTYCRNLTSIFLFLIGASMSLFLIGCPPADSGVKATAPELKVEWQKIETPWRSMWRSEVPGGWLLLTTDSSTIFLPDPKHEWAVPQVEIEEENSFRRYVEADRLTYNAAIHVFDDYLLSRPEDHHVDPAVRMIEAWEYRLTFAERQQTKALKRE